jgi:multidrug resistance efflux pump
VFVLRQLQLVGNLPGCYQAQRVAADAQLALTRFSSVLDLTAQLNAQHRYLAVAMTLCNELAARHKCDRVGLGWRDGEYVRLQALSHTERFEKKMEAIRQLEQAMEEALDQDELIVWPPPEDDTRITRDHAAFAEAQKLKFICSVPMRVGGETAAVITCERGSEPFQEDEQRLLTLSTEMAVRRLSELKKTDRWFGARWMTAAREQLARLVGAEHTWAKVIALLVAVGLGVLFFGRMNYRVEAPFILRTEDVAILTAPFDGFIDAVPREVGDVVQAGDSLLKLDTRDLWLEEAGAAADLDRYSREAEKARAGNQLAEMRIAQAQADQAKARLDLIRYRLGQAEIKAPFAGVIVEGDLKKRIGAPLTQGDALFRVARTDRMYVECDVKEDDIHEVRRDATGEVAFASQPKLKFPVKLERIEPAAQTKEQDNIFIVRCQFDGPMEAWWRPGMSGVAKINVGKRTCFWVVSHRTMDFLRMFFWM